MIPRLIVLLRQVTTHTLCTIPTPTLEQNTAGCTVSDINLSHAGHTTMARELTKKEIYERMVELRNLRKLHAAARNRVVVLEEENKTLKARVRELEKENTALKQEVADIRYQLEELKTILFGKKRVARETVTPDTDTYDDAAAEDEKQPPRTPRTPDSYHRPIPKEEEVTKTVHHRFPKSKKGKKRLRTYYVEDIPLDIEKIVTKYVVEQWYDPVKWQWVSCEPLPATRVALGDNVRVLIATLITIQRLSYGQVRTLLDTLFHIHISLGEIAKICASEARRLTPANDALLEQIRAEESQHMDESRYDVDGEPRYAWSLTGGTSDDTVFVLGRSRGKGVAEELRGDSAGVLVSDDYGAYRTLAEHHQLCYAHLIRKFRDLAEHAGFTETQVQALRVTYHDIKAIYHSVVTACSGPDPQTHRAHLTTQFQSVSTVHEHDPVPAVRLKTTLRKNIDKYLTCLSFPTIALTNNTAERSLRHVVLKRKNSFGCKSERGAQTLGTLLSVLLSLHRKDPSTYFERYLKLRRV